MTCIEQQLMIVLKDDRTIHAQKIVSRWVDIDYKKMRDKLIKMLNDGMNEYKNDHSLIECKDSELLLLAIF